MPADNEHFALEPGTAAGVSRRRFLGAMAAGPVGALLAEGIHQVLAEGTI